MSETQNPYTECPKCNHETYITNGEDYNNVWCTHCEWFTEIDKPYTLADAQRDIDAEGLEHYDPTDEPNMCTPCAYDLADGEEDDDCDCPCHLTLAEILV